jgi:hypothetical protein
MLIDMLPRDLRPHCLTDGFTNPIQVTNMESNIITHSITVV